MPRKKNVSPGVYQYRLQSGAVRWGAVYYVTSDWKTGKPRQKRKQGFLTKADALRWRVAQLDARNRGGDAIEPSKQPLDAYLDDWLASLADLAPSTRRSYRNNLVAVRPALGHLPLAQITPAIIEQFHAQRSKQGDPPAGIYFTHRILKRALRKAYQLGLIPSNPYDRVRAPREPGHEPTTWTLEEMQRFLSVNGDHPTWGLLWSLLAETWIRIGEAGALRWSDVDTDRQTLRVGNTVTRDDDLKYMIGPTKTAKSRRTIRLSHGLTERLVAAREIRTSDYVFPAPVTGGLLKSQSVAHALVKACNLAGVPILTPHELRHNGGSLAYMNGVDIKTISERMGHSNVGITLKVYVRIDERHHSEAAEAIGRIMYADEG